jgi:hypothetical protein
MSTVIAKHETHLLHPKYSRSIETAHESHETPCTACLGLHRSGTESECPLLNGLFHARAMMGESGTHRFLVLQHQGQVAQAWSYSLPEPGKVKPGASVRTGKRQRQT